MSSSGATGGDAFMEQLRNKHAALTSNQSDNWTEFAKQIRMATLERKQIRDMSVIQTSLDKLQGVIKAQNLQQVLERVESECKKLRLNYNKQDSAIYISIDIFYVEILCDLTQAGRSVRDVRVIHKSIPCSASGMADALRNGDVPLFMEHIKGFLDMYNAESGQSDKAKCYICLQSLENDLEKLNKLTLNQYGKKTSNVMVQVHRFPLGLVQARKGGLPMRLAFFITPYDFLNEQSQASLPWTAESILNNKLGIYATVGIEQHPNTHNLQTIPLMNISRNPENKLVPAFSPTTNINSVAMSASFFIKINKPLALSQATLNQIAKLQGSAELVGTTDVKPLQDLIISSANTSLPAGTREFLVSLPGQVQRYFMNEIQDDGLNSSITVGKLVSKLYFHHSTCLTHILQILRQQMMLNCLIQSCVRAPVNGLPGSMKALRMELTVVGRQLLTVTFKHPLSNNLATVDFDIVDVTAPKCTIYCQDSQICTNEHATAVLQRSYSIPVTMRAIIQQSGGLEETPHLPTKKLKMDHAETMQKVGDYYRSQGHHIPYGSVNSVNHAYTKNISTNQYTLCKRRFAGYKRRPAPMRPFHSVSLHPKIEPAPHLPSTLSSQFSTGEHKVIHNPMLESLLSTHTDKPTAITAQQQANLQQQVPILTNLLGVEGAEATDKKTTKKPRKRRTTSDSNPPSAGGAAARKRKKSDNEESMREANVKLELEQAVSLQRSLSASPRALKSPGTPAMNAPKLTFHKPATCSVSPTIDNCSLAKLLESTDHTDYADVKPKLSHLSGESDSFDGLFSQVKQEPKDVLVGMTEKAAPLSVKIPKPKKMDDKRMERSASVSSDMKKAKRSDAADLKRMKESKSLEVRAPESPGKKGSKLTLKQKGGKPAAVPKAPNSAPVVKTEQKSPRETKKKPPADKEKKKKTAKSSSSESAKSAQPAKNYPKMGSFYGASSLKSLPKIPKIKAGDGKPGSTSPLKETAALQKSPVPSEWQRTSPILRTSTSRTDDFPTPGLLTGRSKSFPGPGSLSPGESSRRPALLPTPSTPPIGTNQSSQPPLFTQPQYPQQIKQRKGSLNDVIHKLSSRSTDSTHTSAVETSKGHLWTQPILTSSNSRDSVFEINSPDDQSHLAEPSKPISIPIHKPDPESPTMPSDTKKTAPMMIPLDTDSVMRTSPHSHTSSIISPTFNPSRVIARPLTFSPKSSSDSLLDDDLALGCK